MTNKNTDMPDQIFASHTCGSKNGVWGVMHCQQTPYESGVKYTRAALQNEPVAVDVEGLKAEMHNILAGSEDIDKSQWDIADETINHLISQNIIKAKGKDNE